MQSQTVVRRKFQIFLLKRVSFLLIFCLLSLSAVARISPETKAQIMDEAGVLSSQCFNALLDMRLDPSIAIVIPRSFEGKTIDQYGIDLSASLKTHRCALIVIDPSGTQSRLVLDKTAESKMTVDQIHYINRQLVLASIRQGDFDGAVLRGAQELNRYMKKPMPQNAQTQHRSARQDEKKAHFFVVFGIIFLIYVFFKVRRALKEGRFYVSPGHISLETIDYLKTAVGQGNANSYIEALNERQHIPTRQEMIAGLQQTFQKTLKNEQPVPDFQPNLNTNPVIRNRRVEKMKSHIHTDINRYKPAVPENRVEPKYNKEYTTKDRYDTSDRYKTDDLF